MTKKLSQENEFKTKFKVVVNRLGLGQSQEEELYNRVLQLEKTPELAVIYFVSFKKAFEMRETFEQSMEVAQTKLHAKIKQIEIEVDQKLNNLKDSKSNLPK
jgi:hypothetical protein